MAERHNDALYAQLGATNPIALAKALTEAVRECTNEGMSHLRDPACRLIVHQLAHLYSVSAMIDTIEYNSCIEACKKHADESTVIAYEGR